MALRRREPQTADGSVDEPHAVLLHDAERVGRRHPLLWGLLLGVVVVIAVVLVIVQNTDRVHFEWLVFDGDVPLWLLMVASALVGAAVLALAAAFARSASRRASRRRTAVDELRGRQPGQAGRRATA